MTTGPPGRPQRRHRSPQRPPDRALTITVVCVVLVAVIAAANIWLAATGATILR